MRPLPANKSTVAAACIFCFVITGLYFTFLFIIPYLGYLPEVTIMYFVFRWRALNGIFVDKGDPYKLGPLKVAQLTLAKTVQGAPLHTEVFFPLEAGDYSPIFFVGGWRGLIPAELYEDVQTQLASHGFVVFGVDPSFPLMQSHENQ
ncbi:hypothetical protein BaRGS_00011486 [Batillaria attramentaria]|uniref:Uncharacterized protein n=1 Tax=Batillaria attramentaria TaxID=370345 RepID=A0ABD0LC79_9CAEN